MRVIRRSEYARNRKSADAGKSVIGGYGEIGKLGGCGEIGKCVTHTRASFFSHAGISRECKSGCNRKLAFSWRCQSQERHKHKYIQFQEWY